MLLCYYEAPSVSVDLVIYTNFITIHVWQFISEAII